MTPGVTATTPVPLSLRTPSLVSRSSASTFDSPRPNGLRRKPSGAIDRYAAQKRSELEKLELFIPPRHSHDSVDQVDVDDSVFGILPPPTSQPGLSGYAQEPFRYMGLPGDFTNSSSMRAPSRTPSTRYTDSPFSHVPTPSSASSCSPGFAAVASATRSPQSGYPDQHELHLGHPGLLDEGARTGLQPVRESSTSSSSTLRTKGESKSSQREREQRSPHPTARSIKPAVRNKLTKEPSWSRGRTTRVPPELAHLNVDTPKVPSRPSRAGIASITDMSSPSPVVQSDLSPVYTTYHKRTSSQEIPSHDGSSGAKGRFGFPSRSSSRNASPRIDSAISPPPTAVRFPSRAAAQVPGTHIKEPSRSQRKDSPAVGSAPSPAKSPRFAFFSRKPKPDGKPKKPTEKPERVSAKGPVAGTGHEGYGRFGARGRSASSTSNISSRSPSSDSSMSMGGPPTTARKANRGSTNSVELDDFLKQRLTPVVLRGSGSTWSHNDSVSDAQGSSLGPLSSQSPSPSLLPSAMERTEHHSAKGRPDLGLRKTSESSDDGLNTRFQSRLARWTPTRASQDSFRSSTGDSLPLRHLDSRNADQRLTENRESASIPVPRGVRNEAQSEHKPEQESSSNRKWNFLQRATASPRAKGKERDGLQIEAVVTKGLPKPIGHYALTDAIEPVDLAEVESLVHDVETSQDESVTVPRHISRLVAYDRRHTGLLPSPTAHAPDDQRFRREAVAATESSPDPMQRSMRTPEQDQSSPMQSRLSPIGRIPAVVSKRDRDRKLSDHSFSRPFVRSQPRPSVKPPGSVYSQIRDMASPVEGGLLAASSSDTWFGTHVPSLHNIVHGSVDTEVPSMDNKGTGPQSDEFITFPDRKGSQQSYVSSSSGAPSHPSWLSTMSAQPPQQDDIWNEYDDLMDAVVAAKTRKIGASMDLPHQLANVIYDDGQRSHHVPPPPVGRPPNTVLPPPPGFDVVTNILSVPQQVSRFLQPSLSPLTPDTITAWVHGYGNGSRGTSMARDSMLVPQQDDMYSQPRSSLAGSHDSRASLRRSRGSRHSRSASLPDAPASLYNVEKHTSYDQEMYLAKIPENRLSEGKPSDKMRRAALVTSKWLSFGRVLFSPANNELRFTSEARILVIDGLSSDWSFHVARTYPSAQVYDMGIGSRRLSVPPLDETGALKNHRQIPVASMSATFPFPKGLFNAVVLRFPTAAPEHAYLNCVSECKRVLRPGGHLEIAVLDLELVNMGSHTHKAVKGLKTRMLVRDTSVCLGNLSDVLVRMIGRKGFEGVQRCVVGVPAAGRMRSQDHSSSGSDSFTVPRWHRDSRMGSTRKDSLSVAYDELHEFNRETDEDITKMIAKVGRWWWSSCYEKALLPTDHSIWNEQGLLRECELQRTSFRLLICYAQKPMQTRRRTVSV